MSANGLCKISDTSEVRVNMTHFHDLIRIIKSAHSCLTHSCPEIDSTSVIWTCHIFENNFGTKHKFTKYLKESCRQHFDEHFSFKYFRNIAFGRQMSPKLLGSFDC